MRSARRRGVLNRFGVNVTLVGEDSDVIAGGFRIVTWLSSGSIAVDGPLDVEYLVVAGGGGGGRQNFTRGFAWFLQLNRHQTSRALHLR